MSSADLAAAKLRYREGFDGQFVIVRTRDAGVHTGFLIDRVGHEALLCDARRIWSWEGANTLSEVSSRGCNDRSRISEPVEVIQVLGVIEIIPCTEEAEVNLQVSRWFVEPETPYARAGQQLDALLEDDEFSAVTPDGPTPSDGVR